ncbi:MAG: hypothetical protein HYR57_08925 [Candidatus Koribacter versatilis]|nr:hypothetical protein [Candidatus Koribacter versatilis]
MNQTKLLSARLMIFACAAILALSSSAPAQQMDVAVGMSTVTAPSASEAQDNHAPQSLTGGAFPSFSADILLFKNFGVQGEFGWRATRGQWLGVQPFRPMFYDFNAIFVPRLAERTYLELLAGLGSQATRFYQPTQVCDPFACRNFVTVNHFMGHFGVGLKVYPARNFFVRPEAHLYLVNDNQEFSSGRAVRYGISIGYTFRNR